MEKEISWKLKKTGKWDLQYSYQKKKDFKIETGSFLLGLVVNEPYQDWWGHGFNPWPHSGGWGSSITMSCEVCCRHSLDPMLQLLWHRQGAIAPIWPLAWKLPYATGAALKSKKKKKSMKQRRKLLNNKRTHSRRVYYNHIYVYICVYIFIYTPNIG